MRVQRSLRSARHGGDRLGRWILPAAWCIGIVAVAAAGSQSDEYLRSVRGIPPPHPYPFAGVVTAVAVMTAEVALLAALLRIRPDAWPRTRAALAAALAVGIACVAVTGSLHAPPFVFAFIWWTIAVGVVLAIDGIRKAVSPRRPPGAAPGDATTGR